MWIKFTVEIVAVEFLGDQVQAVQLLFCWQAAKQSDVLDKVWSKPLFEQ